MKTLKFDPSLVPLVLDGSKTSTWRLFDDKDLQVGDRLSLVNRASGDAFAEAEITEVREKQIREITDKDYEGHEPFESVEKMMEAYRKYYGDGVVPETAVKIVRFKLVTR
jgi:hypothetical protein